MYAGYYNQKYRQTGHSFDGPYHAHRQKGFFFILKRLAYVFLNPVVGGLVTRPDQYRWSSYRSYLGMTGLPLDVDPAPVYRLLGGPPSNALPTFLEAMKKEASRPKRKRPDVPPAIAVLADQFEWLLEHARAQAD